MSQQLEIVGTLPRTSRRACRRAGVQLPQRCVNSSSRTWMHTGPIIQCAIDGRAAELREFHQLLERRLAFHRLSSDCRAGQGARAVLILPQFEATEVFLM